jgi:hypothetical protein
MRVEILMEEAHALKEIVRADIALNMREIMADHMITQVIQGKKCVNSWKEQRLIKNAKLSATQ